ncbi:helix-turn-helix domain-containing protein [Virgibacillus necropolis]|uniref:HTH cro/C1-type domain-containing protein n=1 Tax=Virgibacillus necropolis TaxID=163877 RepID=A0A221MCF8_9BACI|nr:helix-turn-helix transcriptional regulator [Virgibacillus necropolis]ASN05302.1 hypothetical protein CFK40_09900 [Virgibacillus necropolis]
MNLSNEELRIARRALGIPQAVVAKQSGVGVAFISLIECGYRDIPPAKAQALRDALPITDEELETLLVVHKRVAKQTN